MVGRLPGRRWSAPSYFTLDSLGPGFVVGYQYTQSCLCIRDEKGLATFMETGAMLGAEVTVEVGGAMEGRAVEAEVGAWQAVLLLLLLACRHGRGLDGFVCPSLRWWTWHHHRHRFG